MKIYNGKISTLQVFEVVGRTHPALPFVLDDISLAFRLGFRAKTLWWLLLNHNSAYKTFSIKKASGKLRLIHEPSAAMKAVLNSMRHQFLLPLVAELGPHVTAYRPGQKIVDAVKRHIHTCEVCDAYDVPHTCAENGKATCLACGQPPQHPDCPRRGVKVHLDLRDFFNNTRAAWIREYLQQVCGYNRYAAGLMASLVTVPLNKKTVDGRVYKYRGVPQGSPTSGDICNIIADHRLDQPILRELHDSGWVYSRYADDMYFTHPKNLSEVEVNQLIHRIERLVVAAGWRLNREKIDVQRPRYQQRLLGVTLNRKPNIPAAEYRRMRSLLYRCHKNGIETEAAKHNKAVPAFRVWLNGKLAWYKALNEAKATDLMRKYAEVLGRNANGT